MPETLDWDLWLGAAEPRPYTHGGEGYPNQFGGYFYTPFNWRGFYDFGCGALGDMACHILGAPNMALHLGAPTSVECIKKEGASSFMFPKSVDHPLRFPGARLHAPGEDLLVRRIEGNPANRRRAEGRTAGRPAVRPSVRRPAGQQRRRLPRGRPQRFVGRVFN